MAHKKLKNDLFKILKNNPINEDRKRESKYIMNRINNYGSPRINRGKKETELIQ